MKQTSFSIVQRPKRLVLSRRVREGAPLARSLKRQEQAPGNLSEGWEKWMVSMTKDVAVGPSTYWVPFGEDEATGFEAFQGSWGVRGFDPLP